MSTPAERVRDLVPFVDEHEDPLLEVGEIHENWTGVTWIKKASQAVAAMLEGW